MRDTHSVSVVKLSTTDKQIINGQGEYNLIDTEDWMDSEYVCATEINGERYGIHKDQITTQSCYIGTNIIPFNKINMLDKIRMETEIEIITVGISDVEVVDEYKEIMKQCDILLHGNDAVILPAIRCIIELLNNRGVLHKEAIISLLKAGSLLKSANLDNVQPASYDLRLSDMIWCKGKWIKLTPESPTAKIPPYSYIIVKALEEAKIPKFITGRYDVKVSLFIQGITLSNGPQVDPGYPGVLLCLLFNASDRDVGINCGEHFATIEFLTISKVTEGYSGQHQDKKELADFMEGTTAASSGGTIVDKFDSLKNSWSRYKSSILKIGFTLLCLILTALYLLVGYLIDMKEITTTVKAQQTRIEKLLEENKIEAFDKRLQKYENKTVKNEEMKQNSDNISTSRRKSGTGK